MTAAGQVSERARRTGQAYRGIRDAHPVTVLRWLRNGVLVSVTAATLIYLWVALAARGDIDTVSRTGQVVASIAEARTDAGTAQTALVYALDHGGAAIEITIGVTLDAKLGAIISSASADAHLDVTLRWHAQEKEKPLSSGADGSAASDTTG